MEIDLHKVYTLSTGSAWGLGILSRILIVVRDYPHGLYGGLGFSQGCLWFLRTHPRMFMVVMDSHKALIGGLAKDV